MRFRLLQKYAILHQLTNNCLAGNNNPLNLLKNQRIDDIEGWISILFSGSGLSSRLSDLP